MLTPYFSSWHPALPCRASISCAHEVRGAELGLSHWQNWNGIDELGLGMTNAEVNGIKQLLKMVLLFSHQVQFARCTRASALASG